MKQLKIKTIDPFDSMFIAQDLEGEKESENELGGDELGGDGSESMEMKEGGSEEEDDEDESQKEVTEDG